MIPKQKLDYSTFNKVVLFIVADYIHRTKQEAAVPPILHRLEGAIVVFKRGHQFSVPEAKQVLKIAQSDEISNIMNKEVSFMIFAFELMKLWVEYVPKEDRPLLNISDKHFKLGGRVFYRQMIKMKHSDAEKYEEKTNIINDSVQVASEFLDYHKGVLLDKAN